MIIAQHYDRAYHLSENFSWHQIAGFTTGDGSTFSFET